MVRNRVKHKGRAISGSFVALPHACLNHENFTSLNAYAVKLLIDLYAQYKGNKNGDLSATWSMMKKRGWRSPTTLSRAKKELLERGWILVTRYGGQNLCTLYAVTFQAIDDCKGKLDCGATTCATGTWKEVKN